jgi:IS5 family transposase
MLCVARVVAQVVSACGFATLAVGDSKDLERCEVRDAWKERKGRRRKMRCASRQRSALIVFVARAAFRKEDILVL